MTSKTTFSVYDNERTSRVYQLPGQQKVYFDKDPQFGFWSVHFDKGGIPHELMGKFSSFQDLFAKTNHYLKNREKFKCEIGEEL